MMKRIKLFFVGLLYSALLNTAIGQTSFGTSTNINSDWKFTLSETVDAQQINYDDTKWQSVDLPHDWSVKGVLSPSLASCTGYLPGGIGWYRKILDFPEKDNGKKTFIYFEGVYNRSEVYFNGHLLGNRPNGYISFMYDLTPFIQYGGKNVLTVKADHSRYADSRWYTGSGIYRDVYLVESNSVHIEQWGVFAYPEKVTHKQAYINVEVSVINESTSNTNLIINNELISPDGKVVALNSKKISIGQGNSQTIKSSLAVKNPQLWSLDNPALYQLKTTVLQDGKVIDETTTTTGIRTFTFNPDKGFALNGEWMKMKGVCVHHDAGVLGAAVPREVWRDRLLKLKEIGCNAIRTSHNPQAPALYELCDELGMLVMNEAYDEWEFPKRKWIQGWNVGTPGFEGSYDFFEQWGERDLADMVKRDRNHASIFAWSIGNEVDYPNDPYSHPILDGDGGFTQAMFGGYKKDAPDAMRLGVIAQRLAKLVKQYDTSRPVTAGLAGVAMSNETAYPDALDIAGYNYTESRYDSDHKKYPKRVIYGSENRHDMDAWKSVRDREHIFGQFLWTGIDYLGESGRWSSRGFYSGLLDLGGNIKPRGYFRQSLWSETPMAYIGTYPIRTLGGRQQLSIDAWPVWNYNDNQTVRVVCYTNCSKAQLELNGKVIGSMKEYDDSTGVIYWDIPYESGKLEVVAYDEQNKETVRNSIQTSNRSHALKIISANETIERNGLSMIRLQVVDENDIPVLISDEEVTCRVNGPGKLIGLEASNNSDMGNYNDNVQRVFHGQLLAYIQSTGEEGQINVQFSAPWLEGAQVEIMVK